MTYDIRGKTLSQLETDTRNLLNDNVNFEATSPDSLTALNWDSTMMRDAINFAIKEYCRLTDVTYLETVITSDNSGIITLPLDRLEIKRVKTFGYTFVITAPAEASGGSFTVSASPVLSGYYYNWTALFDFPGQDVTFSGQGTSEISVDAVSVNGTFTFSLPFATDVYTANNLP